MNKVVHLVRALKTLPALPDTVEKVRGAMKDLTVAPRDVAAIITRDPAIAAKVVSVANSPAYGFPHKVDTIELAVALLGLRDTLGIVMSAAVINLFEVSKRFDYKAFWEEAMASAQAARAIVEASGQDVDGAPTAALLHDIGRIALLETVPDLYAKVPSGLVGAELIAAEHEHVGIAHTEAGYELASSWELPEQIAVPIRFHHAPEQADSHKEGACIVALAELWTRTANISGDTRDALLESSAPLLDMLGMPEDAAADALDAVASADRPRFEWSDTEVPA
jgi:putative nucleotidyltransferase with HDIG domain